MWINPDVRVGSISLMSYFNIFVVAYILFNKQVRTRISSSLIAPLKTALLYIVFSNLFFLFAASGNIYDNLLALKSSFIAWVFYFAILYSRINDKTIKKSSVPICISLICLTVYGIYSYISSSNPFMDYMSQYMSDNDINEVISKSMEDERVGLKGRITGTSLYTIQYAIMLCLVIFLLFYPIKQYVKQTTILILFCLAFLNIYLTGSRGPLAALLLGYIFYFYRNYKLYKQISVVSLLFLLYFVFESAFDKYVAVFFSSNISGSSIEGRGIQFYGAYLIVSDNLQSLILGKGPAWIPNYINRFGSHPMSLYFESTHVAGLVTYGFGGLIFVFLGKIYVLWKTAYTYYKKNIINKDTYYIITSLLLTYFVYNIMVGNVYENLFIFVYLIILIYTINSYMNTINNRCI